jgi:hypothetical protein
VSAAFAGALQDLGYLSPNHSRSIAPISYLRSNKASYHGITYVPFTLAHIDATIVSTLEVFMALNRATQNWPTDEIYEAGGADLTEAVARATRLVDEFTDSIIRFLDNSRRTVDRAKYEELEPRVLTMVG